MSDHGISRSAKRCIHTDLHRRGQCLVKELVRDQWQVRKQPPRRQVYWHILCHWYRFCSPGGHSDFDTMDFLLNRGECMIQYGRRRSDGANSWFMQASRKLHERMAFAIFRSPMTFFETTPAGRILNRFSRYVQSGMPCILSADRLLNAPAWEPYCHPAARSSRSSNLV